MEITEGKVEGGTSSNKDKFALPTVAKVSLSDNNNARDYELLVIGTGFNDKTTATAYVMTAAAAPDTCQAVVDGGSAVGSATVGSDDKVSVTVTVSVPAFKPGAVNQICLVDGEGRTSGSDVETFELGRFHPRRTRNRKRWRHRYHFRPGLQRYRSVQPAGFAR